MSQDEEDACLCYDKAMDYQDINAETISRWISDGWQWGVPIDSETYGKALNGEWNVKLTPKKDVPHSWFGQLKGKRLLGLASGGGQQIPIFSALGAKCTVLDYNDLQLESERLVSQREGYDVEIIKADMSKPLPFTDESFDIIFCPPSVCYIEKVEPLLEECARILKEEGILMITFENGLNYICDAEDESRIVQSLPFNPLEDPSLFREEDGVQFSHSLTEQIGGLLKAGFIITDLYEDTNGYGLFDELNIPSFIAVRAVKKPSVLSDLKSSQA